jgi:hypothetical protein
MSMATATTHIYGVKEVKEDVTMLVKLYQRVRGQEKEVEQIGEDTLRVFTWEKEGTYRDLGQITTLMFPSLHIVIDYSPEGGEWDIHCEFEGGEYLKEKEIYKDNYAEEVDVKTGESPVSVESDEDIPF